MTWEEKFDAMNALVPCVLIMRKPGDWYVSAAGRNVAGDGFLRGIYGEGTTPEVAVLNDWDLVVDALPDDCYLAIQRPGFEPREVRWNGYMWRDIP
jgi:hypothetical protein